MQLVFSLLYIFFCNLRNKSYMTVSYSVSSFTSDKNKQNSFVLAQCQQIKIFQITKSRTSQKKLIAKFKLKKLIVDFTA